MQGASKQWLIINLMVLLWVFIAKGQDMNRVRINITTLCSEALHGRGAAMSGDSLAAVFLAKQFEYFQLKNFNESYYQPFRYDINTFEGNLFLKAGAKKLVPGKDYILHSASSPGSSRLRVVTLDTAIFTSEKKLQDFFGQSLKNKALLIPKGFVAKLEGLPEEYQNRIQQAGALLEMAGDKLTASLATHQERMPHFQLRAHAAQRFRKIKYKVDAALLRQHLSNNVIGYIKGKSDSNIVISAHYDHLGQMGRSQYFPGANDNASGVSMLLELAAFYSQLQNQAKYNLVFMAFAAEEAGLIGSRYYTQHPLFPLLNIKFMINLDLMGTGDEGMMVVNGAVHQKEFELLQAINEKEKYLPAIKKRGKAANSDHYFFSEKGVPAFFFYTLGGIAAYHDVYDRPETLPLTKYKEVFQLITDFVQEL